MQTYSDSEIRALTNRGESKSFTVTALQWRGSVSPHVLLRVGSTVVYSAAVGYCITFFPWVSVPVTPFEYSGAVLGLLLVLRVNAGHDRWWEARKLWGSIVNQSRNLAIIGTAYTPQGTKHLTRFLRLVACWPHVMRHALRDEAPSKNLEKLVGATELSKIASAAHPPSYVGKEIAVLLNKMRSEGLSDFAFFSGEQERAKLIDALGACERIKNTPIPLVLAIKVRRFILLYLLLLPMAVFAETGWYMPIVVALVSYPLFSLDEIGAELQNPFSPRNLSHLPLTEICGKIESNIGSLMPNQAALSPSTDS